MTPRPKITDAMIKAAALQVAAKVGGNAEDIANQYTHPMDGYELGKALERWCYWDIKRSDIDDLDEMEWIVRQLHEEAVKQWVVGFDIPFFTQNTEFQWHELLDRTHCVIVLMDEIVNKHELGSHPAIIEHASKAMESLGDLYQKIGEIRFSKEVQGHE